MYTSNRGHFSAIKNIEGKYLVNKDQQGFSLIIVIILVAVAVVGSGAYYAVKRNSEQRDFKLASSEIAEDVTANGTALNAVMAASEQINAEVIAEDAAMKIEEDASEFSDDEIDELGKVSDEANL